MTIVLANIKCTSCGFVGDVKHQEQIHVKLPLHKLGSSALWTFATTYRFQCNRCGHRFLVSNR